MSKLAITGLSGELGKFLLKEMKQFPSGTVDLYSSHPSFQHPQIEEHIKLNLLDLESVKKTLSDAQPNVILHLAGMTHIDACEEDRTNGKGGKVWKTNVSAIAEIVEYCITTHSKLIYLSTECVFDGDQEFYSETAPTHPINWYGETKAAAEKIIVDSQIPFAILRATIAYHPQARNTLWQKVVRLLETQPLIKMADDHLMTPTYLSDVAEVLDVVLKTDAHGIFHVGPTQAISPYNFAQKIAESLGYSTQVVVPVELSEILGEDKASLRLKHACLDSDKSSSVLHLKFKSIEDVIKDL